MRYTPFESMERLFDDMRRDMLALRENMYEWPALEGFGASTAMDLTESEDEYVFTADLPGFDRDEIDLRIEDHELVLAAVHDEDDDTTRRHRSVAERVTLPRDVVDEEITATYRNGVLEVHIPIAEDAEDADDAGHAIDIE